jgi:pyruvate, orthophosphate dikinase
MSRSIPRVYAIGGGAAERMLPAEVVGNKAANLARLDRLGLRVPPAVALPVAMCRDYIDSGARADGLRATIVTALRHIERATGCTLGGRRPLLVSVRSSPPTSMPGMLKTVLDVGITEQTVHGLICRTGNPWLAWDAYRRFARSFADAVAAAAHDVPRLDRIAAEHLARAGAGTLQDLDPIALRDLARATSAMVETIVGAPVPSAPLDQIVAAVEAVFRSWMSPAAGEYRRLNGLPEWPGTGVLVQAMVFGNSGARSGSGVAFTRNPATGVHDLYSDFVFNAQGEDVVSGRLPIVGGGALRSALPEVWAELTAASAVLEHEFRDMQDVEFTVDEGQLFFLQTRSGKRTPWAALRIAVDLVREGLLAPAGAVDLMAPYDLDAIVRTVVRPGVDDAPIARGTPAGIGVATGRIAFDPRRAQQLAVEYPVVLVRRDLTTDDIGGLAASTGVLTTAGGRTSHAAVVARHLGKVCLVGCADLHVDVDSASCTIGGHRFLEGDLLTLDGETGDLYAGRVPAICERPVNELAQLAVWRAEQSGAATA